MPRIFTHKSNRLRRINQASPTKSNDQIRIYLSRIFNNLQHFTDEGVGLQAYPDTSYFAAESMLQVLQVRSVPRQGARADDVDLGRMEFLVDVLTASFGER